MLYDKQIGINSLSAVITNHKLLHKFYGFYKVGILLKYLTSLIHQPRRSPSFKKKKDKMLTKIKLQSMDTSFIVSPLLSAFFVFCVLASPSFVGTVSPCACIPCFLRGFLRGILWRIIQAKLNKRKKGRSKHRPSLFLD